MRGWWATAAVGGGLGLVTFASASARAEPPSLGAPDFEERRTALWVPPLFGEWLVGAGVDSRLALGSPEALLLPSTTVRADGGYRIFLDDRGSFGLGGYASAGVSLPLTTDVGRGDARGFGGGFTFQYRAMNEDFIYVAFASFIEASALSWSGGVAADGALSSGGDGVRLAVGMELGPGLLWWLDPFVFGESIVRFGLEYVRIGGAELNSVLFGWSFGCDVASRAAE